VSLAKADALTNIVLAAHPQDRAALFRSASIAQKQAAATRTQHRNQEALAFMRETKARLARLEQVGIKTPEEIRTASYVYGDLGREYYNLDQFDEAAGLERRSADLARLLPREPEYLKNALSILANVLRYQGDLEGADRTIREARQAEDRVVYPNETQRMVGAYGILLREGMILGEDGNINLGKPAEAAAAFQKAVDLMEQAAERDPRDYTSRDRLALVGMQLGNVLRHSDPARALTVYDLALRRAREVRNVVAQRREARLLAESSYPLRQLNRSAEARRRVDQSLELLKETKDFPAESIDIGGVVYFALYAQADQFSADGNPARAAGVFESILKAAASDSLQAPTNLGIASLLSRLYDGLARSYESSGDAARADAARAKRTQLWDGWNRKLPGNSYIQKQLDARSLPLSESSKIVR
jgi:hypothetical protein